jgi:hypothetical protein
MKNNTGIIDVIIFIVIMVSIVGLMSYFMFPISVEKLITIKDKCCSTNGYTCYVIDSGGEKIQLYSINYYNNISIGATYHMTGYETLSGHKSASILLTDEEYSTSCEAKGVC